MRTAYLVAWLDMTRGRFPTVTSAGVYSEAAPTTESFSRAYPVEMIHADGADFEGAMRNLRALLRARPHFAWAVPVVDEAIARARRK